MRLQDLDEAVRRYLAWESILAEKEALNLDPHQVRQAETQKQAADGAVTARLPETYQWLLVPEQANAAGADRRGRRSGSPAATRWPCARARSSGATSSLVTTLGSTILRKHLDDVPLWRGEHVAVKQLVEDFARYLYLPRLAGPEVLVQAIRDGVALLTWRSDTFAYAESYDEGAARYRGLRGGQLVSLSAESAGLLVKPDVARRQMDAEAPSPTTGAIPSSDAAGADVRAGGSSSTDPGARGVTPGGFSAPLPRRFHGTVSLDPARVGRDASRIADEVIAHLAGQVGAEVTVTLEIEAALPNGASDQIVRTVTENSRTLKFTSHGFEKE